MKFVEISHGVFVNTDKIVRIDVGREVKIHLGNNEFAMVSRYAWDNAVKELIMGGKDENT